MPPRPRRRVIRRMAQPLGLAGVIVLLLLVAGARVCQPATGELHPGRAFVTRVVDGDTVVVQTAAGQARVRYLGIDTPESVDPRRPVERFGKEAADRNRALVEGKTVFLEQDVSETDRFGRLLRYVYLEDGRMVNALLIEEGYAHAASYPPDVKYQERFARLEREARAAKRGLWGDD